MPKTAVCGQKRLSTEFAILQLLCFTNNYAYTGLISVFLGKMALKAHMKLPSLALQSIDISKDVG